jgi:ribosomal protein S12 methylthiotransferase accessory factor
MTGAASPYSDRVRTPEETFLTIGPLLPGYGITRLARLTDLDCLGVPVWNAVCPNARSIVINQGKGITDMDAKVSAAMEALERAVAGRPAAGTVTTSCNALLQAGKAADRLDCLIAAGQADIQPDEPLEWITGTNLMTGETTYIPFEAAALDRTQTGRFWQSSDGLASGNTFDEAVLHGLLERIERDAYVLWQVAIHGRRDARCVAANCFDDPIMTDLQMRINAAGLRLRLFDITSDIGIPCYSALLGPADIAMRKLRYPDVTHGSGAHPKPVRAAIRAITEAAQSRLTFISGARDDISPDRFAQPLPAETRLWLDIDPRPIPIMPTPDLSSAAELLRHTLDHLIKARIDTAIAATLSSEDMPFSVVKIFIPQLENPDGARKRKFGERAISRVLRV